MKQWVNDLKYGDICFVLLAFGEHGLLESSLYDEANPVYFKKFQNITEHYIQTNVMTYSLDRDIKPRQKFVPCHGGDVYIFADIKELLKFIRVNNIKISCFNLKDNKTGRYFEISTEDLIEEMKLDKQYLSKYF